MTKAGRHTISQKITKNLAVMMQAMAIEPLHTNIMSRQSIFQSGDFLSELLL